MACRAHVQIKTTGAQGIESALGEMSPNYMVLDNVTLAGEKVWTNGNTVDNLYKRIRETKRENSADTDASHQNLAHNRVSPLFTSAPDLSFMVRQSG